MTCGPSMDRRLPDSQNHLLCLYILVFMECLDLDVDWWQAGNGNLYSQEFTSCFTDTGDPYIQTSVWQSRGSPGAERFPAERWCCSCHHGRVFGGQSHSFSVLHTDKDCVSLCIIAGVSSCFYAFILDHFLLKTHLQHVLFIWSFDASAD